MSTYPPLSVQQAATMAGTSPTTIKRKITAKELKATQNQRGQYLIEHEDMMTYLAQQRPSGRQGASTKAGPEPTSGRPDELVRVLERELDQAKERIRSLEGRNERLQSELLSLMHELKEALTGNKKTGLSAWFGRVLEK